MVADEKIEFKKVLDIVCDPGYVLRRGHINYHNLPCEYFPSLDIDNLKIMVQIDENLCKLLEEYPKGMLYPDVHLISEKEKLLSELNYRLEKLRYALSQKENSPFNRLAIYLTHVEETSDCNEFKKNPTINSRIRRCIEFLESLLSSGEYVSDSEREVLLRSIDKIKSAAEAQYRVRCEKLDDIVNRLNKCTRNTGR